MPRMSSKAVIAVILPFALVGCGIFQGDRVEERREGGDLRVPPDLEIVEDPLALTVPEAGDREEGERRQPVLPESPRVSVTRFGDQRWLTVNSSAEQVYEQVEAFLRAQGVDPESQRPAIGLIETPWLYTARPFGRGVFAPQIEGEGEDEARVADRYLIRVERGDEAETTDVFVAHRRVARDRDEEWRLVDPDPFLETEALRSLGVYLGLPPEESVSLIATADDSAPPVELERNEAGEPVLDLEQDFAMAWGRVGLALDRAAFTVTERARDQREYRLRYDAQADEPRPESGFLESLAFWRDDVPDTLGTYRLQLEERADGTRLRLRTEDDEPAPTDLAEEVLALVGAQLR